VSSFCKSVPNWSQKLRLERSRRRQQNRRTLRAAHEMRAPCCRWTRRRLRIVANWSKRANDDFARRRRLHGASGRSCADSLCTLLNSDRSDRLLNARPRRRPSRLRRPCPGPWTILVSNTRNGVMPTKERKQSRRTRRISGSLLCKRPTALPARPGRGNGWCGKLESMDRAEGPADSFFLPYGVAEPCFFVVFNTVFHAGLSATQAPTR